MLLALTDMQGRLQGKRLTARHFLAEVAEHGAEGCNYLLARRRRHDAGRGLCDVLLGARLRRLRAAPGPRHAAAGALAGGNGRVPGRRRLGGRLRRAWPRRARSCAASSRAWPSAAGAPTPAPSSSSSCSATPTRRPGTRATASSSPANLYNVDYSLLGTARVEPLIRRIRNSMEAAGMVVRGLQGRVQLRPARDQLPLRRRAAHRRRARDLQERRQGDRRARGHGDHVHGQVRRARGQLVPHPLLARRRGGAAVRPRPRAVRLVPRRPAGGPARADAAAGAEHQLLQALRRRQLRADRRGLGPRQPHLLAARGRARARRCASRTAPAAPT